MATTGQIAPASAQAVAESPWSDNNWTNPADVCADDGSTAYITSPTFDTNDQSYVLKAQGFDFSEIPDGSAILGIIARVNAWYRTGVGSGSLDLCQLLDVSGAKVGTNQCATPVPLTTNDTTIITKGASDDLWGNALTAAWVKDPDFGIALGVLATGQNADVDIDYVTLEVYYTPPAVEWLTGSINGSSGASGSLRRTRRMSATIAGAAAISGALRAQRKLTGSLAGTAALEGGLRRTRRMAGSLAGTSGAAGALCRSRRLSGSLAGTSASAATVRRTRRLAGLIEALSSLTGELTLTEGQVIEWLTGTISGQSAISADLGRARRLSGSLEGHSGLAAELTVDTAIAWLTGALAGHSSITGSLRRSRRLVGTIEAEATISGQLASPAPTPRKLRRLRSSPLLRVRPLVPHWAAPRTEFPERYRLNRYRRP